MNNGNNLNFEAMNALDNPDLKCIQVDDVDYSNSQTCISYLDGWCKDSTATYNTFCELGLDDFKINSVNLYPNPVKNVLAIDSQEVILNIAIYDMLGREVRLPIYNSTIDTSSLPSGLYLLELETDLGTLTQKIIKD